MADLPSFRHPCGDAFGNPGCQCVEKALAAQSAELAALRGVVEAHHQWNEDGECVVKGCEAKFYASIPAPAAEPEPCGNCDAELEGGKWRAHHTKEPPCAESPAKPTAEAAREAVIEAAREILHNAECIFWHPRKTGTTPWPCNCKLGPALAALAAAEKPAEEGR